MDRKEYNSNVCYCTRNIWSQESLNDCGCCYLRHGDIDGSEIHVPISSKRTGEHDRQWNTCSVVCRLIPSIVTFISALIGDICNEKYSDCCNNKQ